MNRINVEAEQKMNLITVHFSSLMFSPLCLDRSNDMLSIKVDTYSKAVSIHIHFMISSLENRLKNSENFNFHLHKS